MIRMRRSMGVQALLFTAFALSWSSGALAADRDVKSSRRAKKPQAKRVELFDGMESGQLEVRFIPKDAKEANLLVRNLTDQPLRVVVPAAFAGVPVLAQEEGFEDLEGGGGTQAAGAGGGLEEDDFNVPPERLIKRKIRCLCLEHGKPDPRPAVPYRIMRIEEYTDSVALQELIKLYGNGRYRYSVAQAAAWHLANDMSWRQLAAKRIRRATGATYPYFSAATIRAAMKMSERANLIAVAQNDRSTGDKSDSIETLRSVRHR